MATNKAFGIIVKLYNDPSQIRIIDKRILGVSCVLWYKTAANNIKKAVKTFKAIKTMIEAVNSSVDENPKNKIRFIILSAETGNISCKK